MWDTKSFEVAAIISRNGKRVTKLPLQYSGKKSQFSTTFHAADPGVYEAVVYAYDKSTGNTGLDTVTFIVKKAKK